MRKEARQKGVSLAELLVVLAITVVLAAILLPALATPNPGDASTQASMDSYVVAVDGPVSPRSHPDEDQAELNTAPALDEVVGEAPVVEFQPVFNASGAEVYKREGLDQIRTTDISYEMP